MKRLIKEKRISEKEIVDPQNFKTLINKLDGKNISVDSKSCSFYNEKVLSKKFRLIKKEDPIYLLKSIKNKTEINNMIKAHILDGVALTKFIYWIKEVNKKKISEVEAQNKLEIFRKKNKDYLFPSFETIAGSGNRSRKN